MTRRAIIQLFEAHPAMECITHPNAKGLGPRTFKGTKGTDLVFERPMPNGPEPSYLPIPLAMRDLKTTQDGFTLMGGAIAYRWTESPPGANLSQATGV